MSANLENSTVATSLEYVSFHSNPKEGLIIDQGTIILQAIEGKKQKEKWVRALNMSPETIKR